MKRRLILLGLALACLCAMSGCEGTSSEVDWDASCEVYLDNLPEEYRTLPASIREQTSIRFDLTCEQVDKEYTVKLTEENGYRQEVDMLPGTYSVGTIYIGNPALGALSVHAETGEVLVEQHEKSQLAVSLDEAEALSEMIQRSQSSAEIEDAPIFARQVQYAGSLLDLNQLRENIRLDDENPKMLSAGETLEVSCPGYDGVIAVLKNTGSGIVTAQEAAVVGMRFSDIRTVFPGGVRVGDTLQSVVHAESGRLGTPSYCTGSPLIGLEGCTVVYLDATSGDRISLEIEGIGSYVTSMSYEFEVYQ